MTIHDTVGAEAETSYRRRQITRQFRAANPRQHHVGRLRRWREARHHHGG